MSDQDQPPHPPHRFEVGPDEQGTRLDVYLVTQVPDHSRSWLQRQIKAGHVEVNGRTGGKVKPSLALEPGDVIVAGLVPQTALIATPEPMPLTILHEDAWVVAIDKPAGLTVHPGSGERGGTLANALAHHFQQLAEGFGPERPGIVHRLDKHTSGVILVAKDDHTHAELARQFRERTVRKEYHTVVKGVLDLDRDVISAPIGPHRRLRERMAVRMDVGRPSESRYEALERFAAHTYVCVRPKTGRTHQIRVHMASIGHPVIADHAYGGADQRISDVIARQALHAHRITFEHPGTGQETTFESPLPDDFEALLAKLRD